MNNYPTNTVLMVPPTCFGLNKQTEDNTFSRETDETAEEITAKAMAEFTGTVSALEAAGVKVLQLTSKGDTPDAVFPNNWFSCHSDGTVILYPMKAPNRGLERQQDKLIETLTKGGFHTKACIDLSSHEQQGRFLEGTGSLVLDHQTKSAYASLSQRTDNDLAREVAEHLGYELIAFESTVAGQAVYHTNVVMSVGTRYILICLETVTAGLEELQNALRRFGKEIVEITREQLENFCGNVIELQSADGTPIIFMSGSAWRAFGDTLRRFEKLGYKVVFADIPTIETIGGGSARCMVAEVPITSEP